MKYSESVGQRKEIRLGMVEKWRTIDAIDALTFDPFTNVIYNDLKQTRRSELGTKMKEPSIVSIEFDRASTQKKTLFGH